MWAFIWDKTKDFVLQGKGQKSGWELSSHWKSTGVETRCKFEPFEFEIPSSIQNPKTLNKSQDQWGKGKKGKTYLTLTVNSTNFVKENLLVLICPIRNKMCFKIKKSHVFGVIVSENWYFSLVIVATNSISASGSKARNQILTKYIRI